MKKNYFGHDALYKKRKKLGYQGWNTQEELCKIIKEIDEFTSHPIFPRSGDLLELGSGAGDMSLLLSKKGYSVAGIEISPTAIEWARKKAKKKSLDIKFIEGNVIALTPFNNAMFDIVFDAHLMHCIIGDDRHKVFSEVYRVLKPGGLFFINTMCSPIRNDPTLEANYNEESKVMMLNGIAQRYLASPEDILDEVWHHGFIVKDHKQERGKTNDCIFVYAIKA